MNEDFINEKEELYGEKKDNNIKYIIIGILVILFVIFLLIKGNNFNKNSLEKQMKLSSKDYYEKYMSINDYTNEYIVTLDMLENANKQGEKYNLKKLENCKKQTTISKIIVDSKTRDIKKIEVELNC